MFVNPLVGDLPNRKQKLSSAFSGSLLLAALAISQAVQSAESEPNTSASQASNYQIRPQSLDKALVDFSLTSGLQVLADGKLTAGIRSSGVTGRYTSRQALQSLLAGTGIAVQSSRNGMVTLQKVAQNVAVADTAPPSAITLSTVKVTGKTGGYDDDSTDPYNLSYTRSNASTATKTDTPIMVTPVSIQVIPRAVLDDQQAIRIQDTIKNVSGVQRDFTYGNGYESFTIRGFSSASNFYRNGIRMITQSSETAHLNQIDILKGPAAMLFGRVEPGGLVNVVTKKPLEQAYYSLQQQFGSYDFYRTTMDATGPVTQDKSLLYRFNLAYLGTNSFRDVVFDDRIFLAPSLTWKLSDATEVNLNFEYKNEDLVDDSGIPAIGNRPASIPLNRFLGEPWEHYQVETELVDFNWSHKFNDHWKIQNGFVWNNLTYNWRETYHTSLQADNKTLNRSPWLVDTDRESHTVYASLTGDFDTLGLHHNLLLGGDYFSAQRDKAIGIDSDPMSTIDIFNPVYGAADFNTLETARKNAPNFFYTNDEQWYGVYFQDQIKFWDDKLHILGGGRYDWAEASSSYSTVSFANPADTKSEHFSPRVGLLYHPWSWLSLYGNFTESLGSNNGGRSRTGQPFTPQIATQYEAGVKTELFDGRLTSSIAYFYLTKQNVLTPDPVNSQFSVALGEARSQGIEFDMKGQVSDAVSLIGTYAYTDARITKSNSDDLGNRLLNVPEHSGSIWGKYDFVNTPLQGLSFGSGVYLASQREGDNANSFQLPGYARLDAMAAYSMNVVGTKLTTQLNVNNLLDKRYFASSANQASILPADALTIIGSVRLEY
ncbi:TonB-dependent siderophore receptor [Methylovulum miyakonense]|uniref:TonB-dependent siderophore receptor n=1 Tax=Methylovulum miyakonense TaxID=645578 RepID=UPI00036D1F32|nr:TonB-dependent receptor [Methylovulum miyakonense]